MVLVEGSIEPEQTAPSQPEDDKIQNLAYLLEKVEGCSVSLTYKHKKVF